MPHAHPALPPAPPSLPLPPAFPLPPSRPSMAPTNVTFRVSTIGQFSVQHFSYGKEAVDLTICCYVLGDFNRWWPWDGVQDPSSFQMLDQDGDGIYEATIEIPAPPVDAKLWSADLPSAEVLEYNGWTVLDNTAHWRYKVAGYQYFQQENFNLGAPLPNDTSCLLGPVWEPNGAAPTAARARP